MPSVKRLSQTDSVFVLHHVYVLLLAVLAVIAMFVLGGCNEEPATQQAAAAPSAPEPAARADEPAQPGAAQAGGAEAQAGGAEAQQAGAAQPQAGEAQADGAAQPQPGVAAGDAAGDATADGEPAGAEGAPAAGGPLDEAARAIFTGSPTDPPTEELLGISEEFVGRHYVVGDEYNVHLFYPHLKDLGGAYLGVGADQAYLFVGWQKAELAWLIDYDEWVVAMHQAYREFFLAAETVEDFMGYWSESGEEKALALLNEKLAGHPMQEITVTMYKRYRSSTRTRLGRLVKSFQEHGVPSVYHDPATYAYVRKLVQDGRVRPMLANLLDDEGVRGIGKAANELGAKIRVLYVSNAEEYWDYGDNFRANIASLPADEKSVVIRTLSTWKINKDYQYAVQPLLHFQGWLGAKWVAKVAYIVQRVRTFAPEDEVKTPIIVVSETIEEAEARRAERKARKKKGE